jgi:phosphoglycerate dehydrogenase-like enzyme
MNVPSAPDRLPRPSPPSLGDPNRSPAVIGNTSPPERLKAAVVMPAASHALVFGPLEDRALGEMVRWTCPPSQTYPSGGDFVAETEALFTGWGSPALAGSDLAAFPRLRVIFHSGGSVKHLLTDDIWERGIRVTSAARANAIPVAEFTFAQIILSLKQVWTLCQAIREAQTFVRRDAETASGYGSTVGLLSLGLIGRMVAERLRSLEVRVLGFDPHLSPADAAALGVELRPLDEVFAEADVISCHTPLLAETEQLLREHHFARMKPHATFINTARGAIVHEEEMIRVLQRRPDLFAVLDVTDPEPPTPESPLYSLRNVLLTPHLSGSVGPECRRLGRMMVDEARRYLAGEPLIGEITRDQLPHSA